MIWTLAVRYLTSLAHKSLHITDICSFVASWPRFTSSGKEVLQLMRDNITAIRDGQWIVCAMIILTYFINTDFRVEKTDYLNSAEVLNEFEK